MTVTVPTSTGHPLEALTAEEIKAAVAIVRADPRFADSWRFAYVGLEEPPKASVRGFTAGDPVDRLVRTIIVAVPEAHVIEIVVSVTTGDVRSFVDVPGMRPGLLFEESLIAIIALKENAEWQAAMRRRGIEDLEVGPDRPLAGRILRHRPRDRPSDLPLPLLCPRVTRRQRLRPARGRRHRLRRHGPR